MPELPEVETVKRGLASVLEGQRITSVRLLRPDLRVPITAGFAKKVTGRVIEKIDRRAKYLLFYLDDGQVILAHLGMSGSLVLRKTGAYTLQKHDHAVLRFDGGEELIFHDPRRFGMMLLTDKTSLPRHKLFKHLGPEPLSKAFSEKYLATALAKRTGPIKTALMDQKFVVGVGNIYASEALFQCGIHPKTPAKRCARHAKPLIAAIRKVLKAAIASGGSTLRNYASASGENGYFQHCFQVYGRDRMPCYTCRNLLKRVVMAGRATFFCPHCQRMLHSRHARPAKSARNQGDALRS